MAQQRVSIEIPTEVDAFGRQIIGQRIVDFVVERTQSGLGINNRPFIKYSDSYKNSDDFAAAGKDPGTVDLTLSGDMLTELSVLSHSPGRIIIGYKDGTNENDKAEWQRNPKVNSRTGHISPIRDFLGISDKDLNEIVDEYMEDNPIIAEIEDRSEREARAILNRTLSIFGDDDV